MSLNSPAGFVMPPIPAGNGSQQVVIYNIQVPAPSHHKRVPAGTGACFGMCTVGLARTALVLCLWGAWAILIGGVARVSAPWQPHQPHQPRVSGELPSASQGAGREAKICVLQPAPASRAARPARTHAGSAQRANNTAMLEAGEALHAFA